MARQERQSREKPRVDSHQRQVRRNQIIFVVLSVFLILAMVLSMVRFF